LPDRASARQFTTSTRSTLLWLAAGAIPKKATSAKDFLKLLSHFS
jgi:hypothetical protein